MPIEDVKLKNLGTVDAIDKAISSLSTTNSSSVSTSIFENINSEDFAKLVDKEAVSSKAESVFFQNVKAIGAEDIFTAIDKNGDGVLQEDEIAELAELDKNKGDLSVYDIKNIVHDILTKAINALKIDNSPINDAANSILPSGNGYYSMPAAGGYSAPSGSSYPQVYGGANASNNQFSGFSLEELKSEKSSIEANISTLESAVSEAENAVTQAEKKLTEAEQKLSDAEKNMETAEENMNKAVEKDSTVAPETKEALKELDKNITDKETEITKSDESIENKEKEITTNDKSIEDTRNAISEKDKTISSIEKNISDLTAQLSSSNEGSSDAEKAAAKEQKAAIRQQISEAKTKLANEQKERENLETKRDELLKNKETLTEALTKLKAENQQLQDEKLELLNQKSELGNQIIDAGCKPETQVAIKAFDTAKAEYETSVTAKADSEKEVDTTKETLDKKQSELDKEQDNLNKVNNLICLKENNGSAEDFIATAMKYIGKNEADDSYKMFTNGRTEAWCADFVSYVAKEFYGDDLPAGFGSPAVSNLWQWGKDNNRVVDFNNVKAGDVMIQKSNGASHTGIVTGIDPDGTIHTIEGNTSDQVAERTYKPGSSGYNKITCFLNIEP